ncbi:phage late control D family protein [Glaesserella parasuis]|uniref:Phage late control D family protein n=1 Tax=Glaesserella parasuis TaxID=738 RepID=A0AAJ6AJ58_GLAPU|nr:phage late control D family protein [Glaesserella parasuis]MCT8573221.1 phage late control D family protein [Glaesserella parasuis]MCT8655351.1 phage late control D family protein [Glaesserella parasuis]MCT8836485.1 phage late control D family protein [Glaesserella parasuis]MDG6309254.1 phage late control D family protein [Glaesserella parasuis]MDG6360802.1 phage late control D family protein [Glaesserella parasuis]
MNLLDRLKQNGHRIPAFHLTVRPNPKKSTGGTKDITTLLSQRLMNLTLTDSRGFEADQLDFTLDDTDGLLELPSRGAILSLGLGWKDEALTFKGEYTVDEVEHSGAPDCVTIRARSADLRGSLMNRHERSFHKTTLGKIVQQIADENQLQAMVGDEYKNLEIKHIDQTDESSISFLTRLAEEHDAIATVKNGRLLFIKSGKSTTASGQKLPESILTRQDGDSHRFAIAEGDNYKAVKAYWHDTATGKRGEVIIDENTEVKKVNKTTKKGKVSKKQTSVIQQNKPVESDNDQIKTLRHTYDTEQTALNACKRHFEKLQRGVATFSLNLAEGNAELIPEVTVSVVGFKTEIDSNAWIVTQVTHSLSADSGFTTAIECELKVTEEK